MYSLYGYGLMLADQRAARYAEALQRTVRPGAVVVEIGSGPGVLAVYACALGARRVYAIESDEVGSLVPQIAAANGVSDRVTVIRGDSRHVTLDESADVVVADVRGVLPFSGDSLETMIDARRFVKPGGALIPQRDTVRVSVVHVPALYESIVGPWSVEQFGVDAAPARAVAVNLWRKGSLERADLVSEPRDCLELDYMRLARSSAEGHVCLVAARDSDAHGLAVWFDSDLAADVTMSNEPGQPALLYGQGFFPWPEVQPLQAGDEVSVTFRAMKAAGEYVMAWDSEIVDGRTGALRARFAQSTFRGLPLDLETAYLHSPDAVVTPGPDAEVERFVLSAFDGQRSQMDVATALAARFPDRFASVRDALARVVATALRVARVRGQVALRE